MTGSEACDDGNKVNGDGCTSTCTIEKGFTCPTPGKPCLGTKYCKTTALTKFRRQRVFPLWLQGRC